MAFWNLGEARLVQERLVVSAANATSVAFTAYPVPQGKCWIVLGCGYYPSVAETKTISFYKTLASAGAVSLLNPISMALNPANGTFIEQGMEYTMLPGEYITCVRDSATAGSTMTIRIQFVEIDLPLYTYDEPQAVKREMRALSSIKQQLGGGLGKSSTGPLDRGGDRGGRGGPLPK